MQIVSDAERLLGDLSNSITRQTGFDAVMRVRASTGMHYVYGTDLTQRRTHTRVVGHRSPCARTRSSVSFSGLELGLELGLERKLERAVQQTENINKGAY